MSTLTIGELSERSGVPTSALRFYESKGLLSSTRSEGNQRRYRRDELRRVAFILAAQRVGLGLSEISTALATLPGGRTPTQKDWERLAKGWRPMLEARIRSLEELRDRLNSCIGCGCLSLTTCALQNPDDEAAAQGEGPRYLLGDLPAAQPKPGSAGKRRRDARKSSSRG
ncbi:MAG TPA: redox-sensitive transcriptional activator SoxR [Acidimicrobiales bacterium]|nr:redox-sensitive transcriptional activator SoxR [Acidimicrobiales bacterium]